jgi:hypothetical protein
MIRFFKNIKAIGASVLLIGTLAYAVSLTDIQIDEQGQKVYSLYGNYEDPDNPGEWLTTYSDGILTLPEEVLCLVRQVWKSEIVGAGNVHIELNDKKCAGNEEGRENIQGVANISIDQSTGRTVGKFWFNETQSILHNGADVVTYIKLTVESSPTASEPYGRFTLDTVEEDTANPQSPLLIAQVIASGSEFKIKGKTPTIGFSGYANSSLGKGIYKFDGRDATVLGFNNQQICFKAGANTEDCFPRQLSASATNANVKVNAWTYGIYNADGTRYEGEAGEFRLLNNSDVFEIVSEVENGVVTSSKFGGTIRYKGPVNSLFGTRPGRTTQFGSDGEFWTNKDVLMVSPTNPSQTIPMKLQWLVKTHSVSPLAAKRITDVSIDTSGIVLDASASNLSDPNTVDPTVAKSIGTLPSSVFSQPLKVKGGRVL